MAPGETAQIQTATTDTTSWWVQAPLQVTTSPDTFRLRLLELPLDEFAGVPVALESDSTSFVQVILQRGALIVNDYKVREKTAVVAGAQNVPLMGLTLRNMDASGITSSFIQNVTRSTRDKRGARISPYSMISRVAAVKNTDCQFVCADSSTLKDA